MKAKHVAVGGLAAVLLFAAPPLSLAQPPPGTASREVIGLPSLAPLVESVKSAVVNVDVQSRMTFSIASSELQEEAAVAVDASRSGKGWVRASSSIRTARC